MIQTLSPDVMTAESVATLNFSQTVSLLNEPNMCSGGAETIRTVLAQIPTLRYASRILEVGSNTGFSVLEFASMVTGTVHGIDIEPYSVKLSRAKARRLGLDNAHFRVGDGTAIDYPTGDFDLVYASNVTSFIPDAPRAVAEYYRVLRPFGTLAAVPIYYRTTPSAALLSQVEEAIGAPLRVRRLDDWIPVFGQGTRQPYWTQEFEYVDLTPIEIARYVDAVVAQESNTMLPQPVLTAAAERLHHFYTLFNENLRHAGFAVLLYRNQEPTPFPILHRTRPVVPGAGGV
ncbi:MAG TPA: class I SAM-dependent methyltransferase [Kineosporiaceae bacterium]|nr:class I SAM-dependent methyltransferase [Kineosporiaceae bacterium]